MGIVISLFQIDEFYIIELVVYYICSTLCIGWSKGVFILYILLYSHKVRHEETQFRSFSVNKSSYVSTSARSHRLRYFFISQLSTHLYE